MKYVTNYNLRSLRLISFLNIFLLCIATLILHYSDIYRGQNPLYVSLKMFGWALFFLSIVWSFVNTLFIYFNEDSWKRKFIWIVISIIPCVYIFSILFTSFYIRI